ncbi:MAG TPA: hypothetical protein VE714_00235, partial [Gemmatimonadales bacterium]|nr:hypothetical protein [Gemmatimonadales bacterium]
GIRYVAQAIASGRRGAVLANRADLVGGIVLMDSADVLKARAVLARIIREEADFSHVGRES